MVYGLNIMITGHDGLNGADIKSERHDASKGNLVISPTCYQKISSLKMTNFPVSIVLQKSQSIKMIIERQKGL